MDTRTPEQRRKIMQAVRTKDTGPELRVRQILFRLGYRYRLHDRKLPGSPDIVLKKHELAIFVHGCFWHGHTCTKGRLPKSRLEYWEPKIEGNKARDRRVRRSLKQAGWRTVVVWQCQTTDEQKLKQRLLTSLTV